MKKKPQITVQRDQQNSLSNTAHSINGMINYMNNIHINPINAIQWFPSFRFRSQNIKKQL